MNRSASQAEIEEAGDDSINTPRHGFQGNRGATITTPTIPAGFTIAVSREAGARGSTIGRRVGRKLGWQVYDQELLEYMAQDTVARQELFENLPPAATAWIEACLQQLQKEKRINPNADILSIARVALALGSQGNVILIGRGAGNILPSATTLHVRIVAALHDRIAFMSQLLRLSLVDAAEHVRRRDARRTEFISTHFHRQPDDVHQYDMVLNSSYLGEDGCAELIAQATRARVARG